MRKIGLGAGALLLVGAIYYFSTGSQQIAQQIKSGIHTEVATLKSEGIHIEQKELEKNKDHFVLHFDNPEKVAAFLSKKGIKMSAEDAKMLQGLRIGIDTTYMADSYSAVSFDIYPLSIPDTLKSSLSDAKEKKVLSHIEKRLADKALLVHIDVNKLGNGFKGYMKDINETIESEDKVHITSKSLTFTGDIEKKSLKTIKQSLENMTIAFNDVFKMSLNDLTTNYASTGKSKYDYEADYTIKEALISATPDFKVKVDDIYMKGILNVKNGLLSEVIKSKIAKVTYIADGKNVMLENTIYDMDAKNIDMEALEKLEKSDIQNGDQMDSIIKQLLSKGIEFNIPNFSTQNITIDNNKMDGFTLASHVKIDKNLDFNALKRSPAPLLKYINADLTLTISNGIFALLSNIPEVAMGMMFIQPKVVNNNKVYEVELKDGALLVNGKKMM